MYSSLIVGVASGLFGFVSGISASLQWWEILILTIAAPLLSFILTLILKILKKKGVIDPNDEKDLQDKVDKVTDKVEDFTDDGKINNSNKKDKEK